MNTFYVTEFGEHLRSNFTFSYLRIHPITQLTHGISNTREIGKVKNENSSPPLPSLLLLHYYCHSQMARLNFFAILCILSLK